jgi:hypothetical protein
VRVFLSARAREFRPVAESALAELEQEARRDLGDAATEQLRDGLRRLAAFERVST